MFNRFKSKCYHRSLRAARITAKSNRVTVLYMEKYLGGEITPTRLMRMYIRAREQSVTRGGGHEMKESVIEARLVRLVRSRGGLCFKFVSPGNPGVPDRIVITPEGRTVYVELKTEAGRLAAIQKWQQEEMRKRGAEVRTLKGLDQVLAFVEEVLPA